MLSIRLKRMGTKKRPFYRIVVADSRARTAGPFVEEIGVYDPRTEPALIKVDAERLQGWVDKGARPSSTVRSLIRQAS